MNAPVPGERDAARIAQRHLGADVRAVERLPTGLRNYVYAVTLADKRRVVVRLNLPGNGAHFAAAARWHRLLRPLGVPLPALLHADPRPPGDDFPCMILEYLPGRDLEYAYPRLAPRQKAALAERIVAIQRAVGALPLGPGFGYASGYDDPALHPTWTALLRAELARSRARIAEAGAISPAVADRVVARLPDHAAALARVTPRPFLDDITTKNVLIHDGALSGIVDVDCVCFGDPLLTVALTRMALLSRGFATDYIDYWCAALGPPAARSPLLGLYTAIFCVGFLGELGQRFNSAAARPVDPAHVRHLLAVLDSALGEC